MRIAPTRYIWFDGDYVPWEDARLHVLTPTLHYGWGVFEGIRAHPTPSGPKVFRLDAHVERMFRSARLCGIDMPCTRDELGCAITGLVERNGLPACYLRPLVYAEPGDLGIDPTSFRTQLLVAAWEWASPTSGDMPVSRLRATLSARRRNFDQAIPMGAKACGSYLNAAMARAEAVRAGFDEAILLNADGLVADACVENVFVVHDGFLTTPPLSDGPLPGITRDTVLRLADRLGIPAAEHSLSPSDLFAADEMFLTGTAAGIVAVTTVDGRAIGDGTSGPVTETISATYRDAVRSGADSLPPRREEPHVRPTTVRG